MPIQLSEEIFRQWGFRPLGENEVMIATFTRMDVIAIEGISVVDVATAEAVLKGVPYRLAIAKGLNEACQALIADNYVDDVTAWETEKKTTGPYLLVLLGPTTAYVADRCHLKLETDGSISTYAGFTQAKHQLREWSRQILPELLTSLTAQFAVPGRHFRLRRVDEVATGTTAEGQLVRDSLLIGSARGYSSKAVPPEAVARALEQAQALSTRLKGKVAQLFNAAHEEDDDFMRFVYFFFALEQHVNAAFGQIDFTQHVDAPTVPSLAGARKDLLARSENRRNLRDRFMWCALTQWPRLEDADVQEFHRLKTVRDELLHGSRTTPPAEAVAAIEALTAKVLRQ